MKNPARMSCDDALRAETERHGHHGGRGDQARHGEAQARRDEHRGRAVDDHQGGPGDHLGQRVPVLGRLRADQRIRLPRVGVDPVGDPRARPGRQAGQQDRPDHEQHDLQAAAARPGHDSGQRRHTRIAFLLAPAAGRGPGRAANSPASLPTLRLPVRCRAAAAVPAAPRRAWRRDRPGRSWPRPWRPGRAPPRCRRESTSRLIMSWASAVMLMVWRGIVLNESTRMTWPAPAGTRRGMSSHSSTCTDRRRTCTSGPGAQCRDETGQFRSCVPRLRPPPSVNGSAAAEGGVEAEPRRPAGSARMAPGALALLAGARARPGG